MDINFSVVFFIFFFLIISIILNTLIPGELFILSILLVILVLFLGYGSYLSEKKENVMKNKIFIRNILPFLPKYFVIKENSIDLLIEQNIERKKAYYEIIRWVVDHHLPSSKFKETSEIIDRFCEKYDYFYEKPHYNEDIFTCMSELDLYVIVKSIHDTINNTYKEYVKLSNKDYTKNNSDSIVDNIKNEFNNDDFLRIFKNYSSKSFVNDKDFSDSLDKIFNIVKDINKKIAENPELKYSVSITELKFYHDQLLGLLEKFEKIENCNYKTTDFEAKLKNATVIVKKIVLFYENQLNKIYNDDMMDIEVTAKIFKDIIDEYNSMKI